MELTDQQKEIIKHEGNLVISAGAGCSKTFTLIEYARARPHKKILFLAFNKSIADEATRKFRREELSHVVCKTTHALAYGAIGVGRRYKLGHNPSAYYLGKDTFNLDMRNRVNYKTVSHAINKFNLFCNSDLPSIAKLDYTEYLYSDEALAFYMFQKKKVDKYVEAIWNKMENGELNVCHNWYLKAYQLTKPKLKYDIVMIDEGQDLAPVQLDIFLNQKGQKIIVGDTNQSIYSWKQAVDALEKVDFPRLELTKSFRFSDDIAKIAVEILKTKKEIRYDMDVDKFHLEGTARMNPSIYHNENDTVALLSRTNATLFITLIDNIKEWPSVYIEGGVESLTTLQNGIDIYDIVNLITSEQNREDRENIKSFFVKSFADIDEFEDYAKDMDEQNIIEFIKLAKRYKKSIFHFVKEIKAKSVGDKKDAYRILSTIHKAKGQEYDHVRIISSYDEFPKKILFSDKKGKELTKEEIEKQRKVAIEDINIAYVGVTRAKKTIHHTIDGIRSQREMRDLMLSVKSDDY